jgi:hypothetical protein
MSEHAEAQPSASAMSGEQLAKELLESRAALQPEPASVTEAQLAAFAASRIADRGDKAHIFENWDRYIQPGAEQQPITRVDRQGTEVTVATPDEYRDFMRAVGGPGHESIRNRADLLENYADFQPIVHRLKQEMSAMPDLTEHSAHIGQGDTSNVLILAMGEQKYAVRSLRNPEKGAGTIEGYVAGAVLCRGVPHFEQMVAASYQEGATVSELAPGKGLDKLTPEEVRGISDDQLGELIDALKFATDRGIHVDPKPDNFMYDKEQGYTLLDVADAGSDLNIKALSLGEIVGCMSDVIENTGYYGEKAGKYYTRMTAEDFADSAVQTEAKLEVLKRYRAVVEQKLDEQDRQEAFVKLDQDIASAQERLEHYADPQWVAHEIAERETYKARQAELNAWDGELDNMM